MKILSIKPFIKKAATVTIALCMITSVFAAKVPIVYAQDTNSNTAALLQEVNEDIAQTSGVIKSMLQISKDSFKPANFNSISKNLILLIQSGEVCNDLVTQYFEVLKTNYMNEDGSLSINMPVIEYAYPLIIMALSDIDATNFNGFNLVEFFEMSIKSIDTATSINPYFLPIIYNAVKAYSNEFVDPETCYSVIISRIEEMASTTVGINAWGNEDWAMPDDNGNILSPLTVLANSNTSIRQIADTALTWTASLVLPDGTCKSGAASYSSANTNSTALALVLFSSYGNDDMAKKLYAGLNTYKSSTNGMYQYYGVDNLMSTADAFYGLVTYKNYLNGLTNPFDMTNHIISSQEPPINTEIPATDTEADKSENVEDAVEVSPATSDNTDVLLYSFLILLSAGLLTVTCKKQRLKTNMV